MNSKTFGAIVGVIAAAIVLIGAYFVIGGAVSGRGGTSNLDALALDTSLSIGTSLQVGTTFTLGGSSGVSEQASIGSCITSSSTVFAIANPYAATSTVYFGQISGTQGATTTDIAVATSSSAYLPFTTTTATSSLGANIFGLAGVANATKFFSVMGALAGSNVGYTNPKGFGNSMTPIVVGPGEYIVGFSTSTAPTGSGGRSAGQVAVPASCSYKFLWRN